MNKNSDGWKRSKYTTSLISRIRSSINKEGFVEECGIVPLLNTYSVVAKDKDGKIFNLRLSKDNLEIKEVKKLDYKTRKGKILRVVRY